MKQYDWYDDRFDAYCQAVGFLALILATIEEAIDIAIWELSNVEQSAGACLTAQLIGPAPRLRALVALARYREANPAMLKELTSFGNSLKTLAAKRNRYIHDAATIGRESGIIYRNEITADSKLSFKPVPANVGEMQALGSQLRDASREFHNLKERLFLSLPPWPRTQFEQSPVGFRFQARTGNQDQTEEEI